MTASAATASRTNTARNRTRKNASSVRRSRSVTGRRRMLQAPRRRQDASEGMEALEGGQTDKALEAMQKALDKMRAQDDAQRGGKNLRGGREGDRRSGREGGRGDGGPEEQDFGEGEGLFPGKGKSASPKGEASQRLRGSPYDVGVEGESGRGKQDGYDTNVTGRPGKMSSRLSYMGVIGQYRKAMEDAISREQIPRDFHSQIRDYFQALDER